MFRNSRKNWKDGCHAHHASISISDYSNNKNDKNMYTF